MHAHLLLPQVCLNLNVMMRSATQAAMVLTFMFAASWRLTIVTFILVPVIMLISKASRSCEQGLGESVEHECEQMKVLCA